MVVPTPGEHPGPHTLGLAALDAVAAGILVGFGLGQHLDLGNAGNRRQRLAAEAQGVDVPEVVRRSNLAGSMADNRLIDNILPR